MINLSLGVAFIAGLVSFLSPCVLPIIPGFLAYLAGSSLAEADKKRKEIFFASLFFVVGFSVVFAVVGVVLNTVLEHVAYDAQRWLSRIGGALIIIFGLYLIGLIKLPILQREWRVSMKFNMKSRYATAFLFGAAFAAGWTPCVGPVLGGILGLAAAAPGSAFGLLFSYALGLGIPFLVVGLFASRASAFINRSAKWFHVVTVIFGVILIAIGVLAFTERLALIANLGILNRFLLK